ncbi:MAG: hypothetical protein E2O85_00290, partial [Bacteroidetes bacterium]
MFERSIFIITPLIRAVFRLCFLLATIGFTSAGYAQERAEIYLPSRVDSLVVSGGGPFLIRPFISPHSEVVNIDGVILSDEGYLLDYRTGFLELLGRNPEESGLLVISYEYIPISLTESLRKWPLVRKDERSSSQRRLTARRVAEDQRLYAGSTQLRRSG